MTILDIISLIVVIFLLSFAVGVIFGRAASNDPWRRE